MQQNPTRLLRRAWHTYEAGDLAKAEKSFAAALKGEPQNFDVLDGLGLINYRRGRLDAALVLIQTALQATLAAPMVFRASASSLSRSLAPNDVDLINRRGVALLELGRPDEALAAFEAPPRP